MSALLAGVVESDFSEPPPASPPPPPLPEPPEDMLFLVPGLVEPEAIPIASYVMSTKHMSATIVRFLRRVDGPEAFTENGE
jgi:hypothetical protein